MAKSALLITLSEYAMNQIPDFYLASSDAYSLEEPRACFRIGRLKSNSRDDLLLVRITPPLNGSDYQFPVSKIEKVVVATRFKNESLFPIKRWPVFVYVVAVLVDNLEQIKMLSTDQMRIIAWAELYNSLENAIAKKFNS
ncbi:MAG: hypothetical protein HND45_04900 [Chloroflexi bacterium]|nr:hypothetical protein [Chloroflexota bacterium]GIK10540.1 MAG: hypothetical protein BroJett001_26060 [Chloroflexota bacterium]